MFYNCILNPWEDRAGDVLDDNAKEVIKHNDELLTSRKVR